MTDCDCIYTRLPKSSCNLLSEKGRNCLNPNHRTLTDEDIARFDDDMVKTLANAKTVYRCGIQERKTVCEYRTESKEEIDYHVLHVHGTVCEADNCDFASMNMHEMESHRTQEQIKL